MVEHLVWDQGVTGSNPVYPTMVHLYELFYNHIDYENMRWMVVGPEQLDNFSRMIQIEFYNDGRWHDNRVSFILKDFGPNVKIIDHGNYYE